jgi:hypothetical protein
MVCRCLGLMKRRRDGGEERAAVFSPQDTGEYADSIGLAFLEDPSSFGYPQQSAVCGIGHPNRTFGVEADPVWCHGHLM